MDRRLKALLIAALLCATATLTACGDDASTNSDAENTDTEASTTNDATPLDPPTLAKLSAAPKGTATADDARLANDVLLQLVADRKVDAQHFAIVVEHSILYLMPTQEAADAEIEYAKELVQEIDGLQDVKIEKLGEALVVADDTTKDIVQTIENAHAPQEDAAEEEPTQDALNAEPPSIEAAAELAKPAPKADEQEPAPEEAPEHEAQADQSSEEAEDAGDYREYTLRRGDSLSIVAARELGNGARWTEIYQLNRDVIGPNPDGVRDGMKIKLPQR